MINFSKVARQLNEEPLVDDGSGRGIKRLQREPIVRRQENVTQSPSEGRIRKPSRPSGGQGGMGFQIEQIVKDGILPRLKQGNYKHVDADVPGINYGVKTDIFHDKGGDPSQNTAFSVKSKLDNDDPQKVHQTGVNSGNAFRKLQIRRGQNPLLDEAMDMYLGKDGNFVNAGDMKEEHRDALMKHFEEQKQAIFNSLVRIAQPNNSNSQPYSGHDPRMIDKLISHRKMGQGSDLSGPIDIRKLQGKVTKENFENLTWFHDGKRFFLGENEDASTDERMLDLWPIDEEGSNWSNRVGDGGPQPGQRGHRPGQREAGLPEPGQFKATMATNPEFLDRYFPKEKEFYMDDNGYSLGFN